MKPRLIYELEGWCTHFPEYNEIQRCLEIPVQESVTIEPNGLEKIHLGISVTVPRHHYMDIRPYSTDNGLEIHSGIVHMDYTDNLVILVHNTTDCTMEYNPGDKIVKLCVHESRIHVEEEDEREEKIDLQHIVEDTRCADFTPLHCKPDFYRKTYQLAEYINRDSIQVANIRIKLIGNTELKNEYIDELYEEETKYVKQIDYWVYNSMPTLSVNENTLKENLQCDPNNYLTADGQCPELSEKELTAQIGRAHV